MKKSNILTTIGLRKLSSDDTKQIMLSNEEDNVSTFK